MVNSNHPPVHHPPISSSFNGTRDWSPQYRSQVHELLRHSGEQLLTKFQLRCSLHDLPQPYTDSEPGGDPPEVPPRSRTIDLLVISNLQDLVRNGFHYRRDLSILQHQEPKVVPVE